MPSLLPSSKPSNLPSFIPSSKKPDLSAVSVTPAAQTASSICSSASNANQELEVNFTYALTILPESVQNLDDIVAIIDRTLYADAFTTMVDCSPKDGRRTLFRRAQTNDTKLTSAVGFSNAPIDKVSETKQCGTNCYVVDGGSTVLFPNELFVEIQEVRRMVQDYFKDTMEGGELISIHPGIVGIDYQGYEEPKLSQEGDTDIDEQNEVLFTNGVVEQKIRSEPDGKIISTSEGIIIGSACLIIILVAFAAIRKVRSYQLSYCKQADDSDSSISADEENQVDPDDNDKSPVKKKTHPSFSSLRSFSLNNVEKNDDDNKSIKSSVISFSGLSVSSSKIVLVPVQ
eukprot:6194007-Ditylum_brightwellii.AAC.1